MPCDPNTLLEQAKCITNCISPGIMRAVSTALLCRVASGGISPAVTLKTGLVAYYKLENLGWSDSSPNARTLSASGVPNPSVVAGKFGNAGGFSPTSSLERVDPAFSFTNQAFTVSAWAWQNDRTQDGAINEASEGWSVGFTASTGYHLVITDGVSFDVAQSTILPTNGTWSHILAWFEPTVGVSISVNGESPVLFPTATIPQNLTNIFRVGLGILSYQSGRVDECGVWSRLFTSAEKIWIWNGGAGNVVY